MAKLVDIWRSDHPVNLTPRQMPLIIDDNLTMIMDLNNLGAVSDNPLVRGKQLEEFTKKLDILSKEEIKASFEVTCKDMLAILGQAVPCVGCRRSVERLFYDLMKSAHPALDPLVITADGLLTIKDEILESPQLLCTMLQGHSTKLSNLVERQPRSKKSRRCALHSLEIQRMRPSSGAWREVWDCMKPACRQEVTLVENESLEATLDTYLRKHRFCGECRTKVLLASSLLTTEPEPAKEKGYVPALYAGIKRCIPERHIHLPTNTDYISAIIERAQPELMGRERHAKTLEIAQEEVLTCLGICVSERLHRVHRRLREEETVCRVLAAVAVDALSRNFQMAVEVKQGITQLELLYEELTREELAKQQRREKLRLKRKKKKERRYESDEKENSCECLEETNKAINEEKCAICSDSKKTNENTTHRQEKTSGTNKKDLETCECPDCTRELIREQSQTETSFPRSLKASDGNVGEKKIVGNDTGGGVHHNLEIINNRIKSVSSVDVSFEPCPECKDLFEKRDGEWMIREEFEEPSDKEIMDAWLGRPSKRFSMWMETKKRYDDLNKISNVASKNRRDSSEQSSQDCGYSSEHNISSSSLPSTPEGSELACSESCCNQDEGDCHDSNYHHKLVHSNSNIFLFREQTTGKASHGLTLTQMLEEGYSSEDEGNEESYIPAEEVKEFQSRMCQVIEKRQELRQTLRKRFAILCSHYKSIPRH
ncbi:gametogenetin-binding protein 2-like [Venturia canescens]|uniref:gametogenetin-binding protein 2-like n=1 Tax=Venturia canescens TaxID=32260 RepID=UPI001C9BDE22|nr:gametogenetin-binding protein 2-like [Venturia canescens]XP_043273262.1 gametogenetin-binding protein 2-like [Venturia canescens]